MQRSLSQRDPVSGQDDLEYRIKSVVLLVGIIMLYCCIIGCNQSKHDVSCQIVNINGKIIYTIILKKSQLTH